jgi:D-alanyl-D-alanine carboxypeptidase
VWDPARGAYTAAYGRADASTGRAASVDDHFRIGSISKTFTAAVILQLIDEGLLALDQTIAEADPDLAERFPVLAELTIEQLLRMQSGIPDYMNVPDAAVEALVNDPSTVFGADDLISFAVAGGIQPAGTGGYSTTNYIALQELAETVTGQSLAELIEQRPTGPLGMTDTALPPNEDTMLPDPGTHGYINEACIAELEADGAFGVEAGTDTTDWNASYGQGGGGMHSTIEDLGAWAASMSGTSFLSDDLAAQRLETADVGLGPFEYGLGIIKAGPSYGHEGEAIGWEAWAGHNPETGVTVVLATNGCSVGGDLLLAAGGLDPDLMDALSGS